METNTGLETRMHYEISVFPDERLNFTVKVSHQGKSYLQSGFRNPDKAQQRGVEVMIALNRLGRNTVRRPKAGYTRAA